MRVNNTAGAASSQSPKTSWRESRWSEWRRVGKKKWVYVGEVDPPVFPRDVGPINEVTVSDSSGPIAYMVRHLP
jgi:hypothetical protein